jgi:hypothetical protein
MNAQRRGPAPAGAAQGGGAASPPRRRHHAQPNQSPLLPIHTNSMKGSDEHGCA